jgi:hypothetical protein
MILLLVLSYSLGILSFLTINNNGDSSPVQVAAGLVNGGAVDHRRRLGSPPPKMRGGGGGGTGVFLPRTYVYHAKEESPAPAATKASSRGNAFSCLVSFASSDFVLSWR